MRALSTDLHDPYSIVVGLRPASRDDRGKRYATVPKPEHNPTGGTTIFHDSLEDARERNRWARIVRSW